MITYEKIPNVELLKRALWLCGQIPKLHEISYELGVFSHVVEAASMPAHLHHGQVIIDAAGALSAEIAELLKGEAPDDLAPIPLPPIRRRSPRILRFKNYMTSIVRKAVP